MELKIKQMDCNNAIQISKWVYDGPYSIYSMEDNENCINELLNGEYFYVNDDKNNLVGYYCFGQSAQVPAGNQFKVYSDKSFIDIGLGMKPNLCGNRLGGLFLRFGMNFANTQLSASKLRLTVATFNKRAIKVYENAGFNIITSFDRISEVGKFEFLVMTNEKVKQLIQVP